MSTDFIAVFDVTTESARPEWLVKRLEVNSPALAEVVERYKDAWLPKAWTVDTSAATDEPRVRGPGGFSIHMRPGAVELYHMMRFSTFTGDPKSRRALRRACLFIADVLGSNRAIYTHELMPLGGETLEQIEKGLRTRIGPPAATFEELHAAKYFGPRAWYVDNFSDLRSA